MGGVKLKHNGWVVVMDGEKALFLRNEGDEKYVNLQVFREKVQELPTNREVGSARPGRLNDGIGGHRSAVQETDWHQLAKEDFASEIAQSLARHAQQGRYDQLVLAAPPKTLGAIRKLLHKNVRDRLVAELDKDLTAHPVVEIEAIVGKD